jgi:hypothetical protein
VTWDVVAWNAAAAVVLSDYAKLPAAKRNILRLVFLDPKSRAMNQDWELLARFVVAAFRAGIPRAGAQTAVEPLVRELHRDSPDFLRIWDKGDVAGFGDGIKRLRHPVLGEITLEYSAFTVDGRPDLTMLVFTPNRRKDSDRIRALIAPA